MDKTRGKVVITSLKNTLSSLHSSIANCDALSPTTAMMVVEMYGKSKMGHGLAIWGRSWFDANATMPSRQVRTSRALADKAEGCFDRALRAILGVRGGTSTLAVHRELGWMGLRDTVAKAKITFASSLLALDDCRQPKAALLHRRKSLQWLADGTALLHSHKSIYRPAP